MGENEALQKEIEDAKNQKFLSDLRNLYGPRWKKYKDEFYSAAKGDPKKFNCVMQHMFAAGMTEVLRKVLLAECYNETAAKHTDVPKVIEDLDVNSNLGKKITDGIKGNVDYPSQLKLFQG